MPKLLEVAGLAVFITLLFCPRPLSAQDAETEAPTEAADAQSAPGFGDDRLNATGVGISGGIIAGAELVIVIEAAIGVDALWPYLTFPFLAAAGGGVGGYYLEEASPGGAVALLVVSMAAFIPTVIYASQAMAYKPEKEGAVEAESAAGSAPFSFEAAPLETRDEETTSTEVETRPGASPEGGEPGSETDEAPDGAQPPRTEPPKETGTPDTMNESSRSRSDKARQIAARKRAKRAMAGSLLYVDGQGAAAVTVPFVDVRRASNRMGDPLKEVRPGLEVYVPLVRIDLP